MFTSPIALDVEGGFNLPTTRSEAGQYQADDPMYHYYINGIGFAYDDFQISAAQILHIWNIILRLLPTMAHVKH